MKLELKKCTFFQTHVKYLGYQVSEEGVSTDPSKIEAIQKWPVPTTLRELRHFLGFTAYYRRFVPAYTSKARALHKLVADLVKLHPGKESRRRKPVEIGDDWTEAHQEAFESLRTALVSAPV